MKKALASLLLAGLFVSVNTFAAPPADAPAGTTGLCKDGSYYSGATKKGACKGHKGVKDWYAAADAAPAKAEKPAKADKAAKAEPAAPAAAAASAAPAAAAPAAPAATPKTKEMPKPAATAAAGGGPGLVWVNSESKVYHCSGSRWYGKTKSGEYMSEADATAKGFHADHGKACK